MENEEKIIVDQDNNWKELIGDLFPYFLEFFLPDVFQDIDFEYPAESLDKEFSKLLPEYYNNEKIINDKLIKVRLKSGKNQILFIHIELQSTEDINFGERMFRYYYRIVDKYGFNVTAIALFTDISKIFQPQNFSHDCYGTQLFYKYNFYKPPKIIFINLFRNPLYSK